MTKYSSKGKASYYYGGKTASGSRTHRNTFTAAHKTLRFGTVVRVRSLKSYKDKQSYVDVTIVDRGPYTKGRIIDLTSGAFSVIAPISKGIIDVEIEVLNHGGKHDSNGDR